MKLSRKIKIFLWIFVLFWLVNIIMAELSRYNTTFQSGLTLSKERKKSLRRFHLRRSEVFDEGIIGNQKEFFISTHESIPFHVDAEYNQENMIVNLEKHEIMPHEKIKMNVKFLEKGNAQRIREKIRIVTDLDDLWLEVELRESFF